MNMKRIPWVIIILVALAMFSCDPSTNKTDLERLSSQAMLPYLKASKHIMVSSADSSGNGNDRISVAPGQRVTILNATGPAIINRIWFSLDSEDPDYLRKVVIKIFWDDEKEPSVDVPLGDFFGCGFEYKPYISQYLGMTGGGFVCYFPMPFQKSARIEILNETDRELYSFYYQFDYQVIDGYFDRSVAYFHAFWNRDIRTDYDSNYQIIRATGQGHVVGVCLNIQSYDSALNFLEGNEIIYTDGEIKPSIVGTGTADLFSGGTGFQAGEYTGPYNGLVLKDDSVGRISAYRLYINDPIPFKKSINFTIEHGRGNSVVADYSSTVYFYLIEPHQPFRHLSAAGMRLPLHVVTPTTLVQAEDLDIDMGRLKSETMDVTKITPDMSEGYQLLIHTRLNDSFTVHLKNLQDREYTADIYYSEGPDHGNVQIYEGERLAGSLMGYSPVFRAGGKVSLPGLKAHNGKINLRFVVTGKNTLSKGYLTGLDGLNLSPVRNYIPGWYLLGPFSVPRRDLKNKTGLDSVYMAEYVADTSVKYIGADKQPIRWKYVKTPGNGYLSLNDYIIPNGQVVAFALTWVWSDTERNMLLKTGTGTRTKIFINNKVVYRYTGTRPAIPDQETITVHLKKGWNKVIIKMENQQGEYGFYARFIDPDSTLVISAQKVLPEKR